MNLGAHVSTQGGVDNAPANAAELGITAIQIFAKNQRQWVAKPLAEEAIERWHEQIKEHGIVQSVSHGSYLINLCANEQEKLDKSINSLTDELERAEILGLTHVVFHPGSHLGEGEEKGIKAISKSIDEIHMRTKGYKSKLAIEITAGQGTNLGYTFEQLAAMIEGTKQPERLSICFDSCHAFAAGYDISTKDAYEETMSKFDEVLGLDLLQVIHLNDTKKELGSRRDRHDHIGEGLLGFDAFRFLVNDKRLADVPAILETPEGEGGYPKDLKTLRSLIKK